MSSLLRSPAPSVRTRAAAPLLRAGAVCAFLALAVLVPVAARWSPLMRLDRDIAQALHRRAVVEPGFVRVNRVLTDWVWDPWTMRALIAVVAVVLWWRGARLLAVWVAVTAVVANVLQQALKAAVGRPRPHWPDPVDSAHYAAFPSGHAMTATVSCGLLVWLVHRSGAGRGVRWTVLGLAVLSVLGVGLTRLYLGVHWPSDVLGGWLLGAALAALAAGAYERRESRHPTGSG
ncbi:phosphatase PAP2 family protein [Streptomyces sp. NPDC057682]|uniref:phosphatase PAP2 family protein n=1 Tax=Streptomyces sp. NPDC057682 TaxID=3346210 RepID=UPI003694DA5E